MISLESDVVVVVESCSGNTSHARRRKDALRKSDMGTRGLFIRRTKLPRDPVASASHQSARRPCGARAITSGLVGVWAGGIVRRGEPHHALPVVVSMRSQASGCRLAYLAAIDVRPRDPPEPDRGRFPLDQALSWTSGWSDVGSIIVSQTNRPPRFHFSKPTLPRLLLPHRARQRMALITSDDPSAGR